MKYETKQITNKKLNKTMYIAKHSWYYFMFETCFMFFFNYIKKTPLLSFLNLSLSS